MSKEIREQLNKIKNWEHFLNENDKMKFISTQEKVLQVKKLMEEIISDIKIKSEDSKNKNSAFARILISTTYPYQNFIDNQWGTNENQTIFRLNQFDEFKKDGSL